VTVSQLGLLVNGVVTQLFTLDKAKLTIGRSSKCDIHIDDVGVSTNHALIVIAPNKFLDGYNDILIEDLQSRNGTLVNGQPIQRCLLKPDDVIAIGFHKFKLLDDRAKGRESTVLLMMD